MRLASLAPAAVLALVLVVAAGNGALAHGNPAIRAEPAVVQAGGSVTIVGTDMAPGVEFVIGLERTTRTVELGRATAEGEEDEGGFTVTFTIPAATAPGSYTIRAASASGKAATADLTVTERTRAVSAAAGAATGGAEVMAMATADLHELDRSKTAAELWVFGSASVALALAGAALVRRGG